MEWIAGIRQIDNHTGIVLRRVDQDPRESLVALWPLNADTPEVAVAIEHLAAQLRRLI